MHGSHRDAVSTRSRRHRISLKQKNKLKQGYWVTRSQQAVSLPLQRPGRHGWWTGSTGSSAGATAEPSISKAPGGGAYGSWGLSARPEEAAALTMMPGGIVRRRAFTSKWDKGVAAGRVGGQGLGLVVRVVVVGAVAVVVGLFAAAAAEVGLGTRVAEKAAAPGEEQDDDDDAQEQAADDGPRRDGGDVVGVGGAVGGGGAGEAARRGGAGGRR